MQATIRITFTKSIETLVLRIENKKAREIRELYFYIQNLINPGFRERQK